MFARKNVNWPRRVVLSSFSRLWKSCCCYFLLYYLNPSVLTCIKQKFSMRVFVEDIFNFNIDVNNN